jgi:hypothetical protein
MVPDGRRAAGLGEPHRRVARDVRRQRPLQRAEHGFDHFLDRTAEDPAVATFFGAAMRSPADDRLRTIPVVAPIPVFAWAATWRRRTPETVVDRLLAGSGPHDLIPAERVRDRRQVWLPAADRAWLG